MLILENMKLALMAIRVNKMRSFLTMLGMIIGISSVIAIVSIGDTMRGAIADQYKGLGAGLVVTWLNSSDGYYTDNELFTQDDIDSLKGAFGDRITYISADGYDRSSVLKGKTSIQFQTTGVAEDYTNVLPVTIVSGRMINNDDVLLKRKNIVIQDTLAQKLYGSEQAAVGKTMRVTMKQQLDDLLIVGVYKNVQSALEKLMSGGGSMEGAYVPESVLVNENESIWQLRFYMSPDTNPDVFQKQFVSMVAKMKNKTKEEVVFYTAEAEMQSMDSMMAGLSTAVGAIAAISLVVGGIGIMNIMLVSVTERTREIGIRKALGARTGDVLMQFLVESAIISAVGGVIGTILGVGLVMIGGMAVGMPVVVRPTVIVTAVIFAAVVGIFFGLYPAQKAAKADPITALRYE